MDQIDHWLLPEGIDELLPAEAERLELKRRQLLDLFSSWGYEMVIPPFVEFVDSLLVGTGEDLDLRTFKLVDQMTGRTMGIRADMTPQVARIDAHRLNRNQPTRLCYLGTVLQTRPDNHGATRSPLQIGAELYGHQGVESDSEILRMMIEALKTLGVEKIYLDLGHVAIFRTLATSAQLNEEQESILFDALQRKAIPEIDQHLKTWSIDDKYRHILRQLPDLHGDETIIEQAQTLFNDCCQEALDALTQLKILVEDIAEIDGVNIHIDLAELRGYHYHTGLVFAAYQSGIGQAIAQGGRYDEIGKIFGRARPATGFSLDLKTVLSQLAIGKITQRDIIFAPAGKEPALVSKIKELRTQGIRVIQALPGQAASATDMGCNQQLVENNGSWSIKNL